MVSEIKEEEKEGRAKTSNDLERKKHRIYRYVPIINLVQTYDKKWLRNDLIAGITIAAILIPQGMAYGDLAGVAPVAGLYAAMAALVAFAIFGYSRQLISGPESALAIMTATFVAPLVVGNNPAQYASFVAILSIICGSMALFVGITKLGFLADFVSRPVLIGYLIGVAGIIIASQLGKLFGIHVEAEGFVSQISYVIQHLSETSLPTLTVGILLIAFILALKRYARKIPSALLVVVVATIASTILSFPQMGISVVGYVPAGLPSPVVPNVSLTDIENLIPAALSLSIIALADAVLTARAFAERGGYKSDSNQDIIGLGMSQIAAGLFQGMPVTGSQSRTVVNDQAGGKTQLVSIVSAGIVAIFLLFLTITLYNLPNVALAAIIIVAATGLIEVGEIKKLLRFQKIELLLALIAAVGVLGFGIVKGILLAVILSIIVVIARISRPRDAVLGSREGVRGYHSIGEVKNGKEGGVIEAEPGLLIYRFEAPLFFANANLFFERVEKLLSEAKPPVRWLLLNAEAFGDVDSTAMDKLESLYTILKKQDVVLAIARAEEPLRNALKRTGLLYQIGEEHIFPTVTSGVEAYRRYARKTLA